MNKPKLNQPDVETTTTTINVFEEGMPPTIVYDEYPVKNYKRDFKQQLEQEILKEFEEQLHYKLVHITEKKLVFKNMVLNKILYIHKDRRAYESYDESSFVYEDISIKLHQLLHKLFEIWGWFDE